MMKVLGLLGVGLLVLLSLSACGNVPAGHLGVKVDLWGGDRGVEKVSYGPGRYFLGFYSEMYTFPTFTQNVVWTADIRPESPTDESFDFGTVEGMNVNADIGVSYHVDPTKVVDLFQKYRNGIDEITHKFVRNLVRDELVRVASTKEISYVYGAGKAAIMDEVEKHVKERLKDEGLVIENLYWIGQLRLPKAVVTALNAKIAATQLAQQRENEIITAKAEGQKKIAAADAEAKSTLIRAQSQAQANKILSESLTRELIDYQISNKWDGKLPVTMAGGAVPMINVNQQKQ